MEAHDKAAGWAQAIGGFLAIVAAFLVADLQARQARRQVREQAGESIRAHARLFVYWKDICLRSYRVRRTRQPQGQSVDALNINLSEFNYAAEELNKFNLIDAPSAEVFRIFVRYREMCAPLSNYMHPNYQMVDPAQLDEFDKAIADLEQLAEALTVEAKRLSS